MEPVFAHLNSFMSVGLVIVQASVPATCGSSIREERCAVSPRSVLLADREDYQPAGRPRWSIRAGTFG